MTLADKLFPIQYCFLLFLIISVVGCGNTDQQQNAVRKQYHIHGPTMGTQYSVKLVSDDVNFDSTLLKSEIDSILDRINQSMSTYIDDSEISNLNRASENEYHAVSGELYFVMNEALFISTISEGTFDVTVGPLINLWGFGTNKNNQSIPNENDIHQLQYNTGHYHIKLMDDQTLKKNRPNMYIDLSAIAKGYAVDEISEWIEEKGYQDYMVEIGGEIRVKGKNKNEKYWQIGIEQPRVDSRAVQRVVPLRDAAMATSGDYRNYFEENGRRYSHIIDPVSGKPVQHRLASVSVIHSSAMRADALATAMLVMGPLRAMELAKKNNLAILMLIKEEDSDGFYETMSPVFEAITLH